MIFAALARLLTLAVMVVVGLWIGRLMLGLSRRAQKGAAARSSGSASAPTAGEPMVRDRICNTFLPRAKAIVIEHGGQSHFFCSDRCRERFLGSVSGEKSA